jgi:hypothetical protein
MKRVPAARSPRAKDAPCNVAPSKRAVSRASRRRSRRHVLARTNTIGAGQICFDQMYPPKHVFSHSSRESEALARSVNSRQLERAPIDAPDKSAPRKFASIESGAPFETERPDPLHTREMLPAPRAKVWRACRTGSPLRICRPQDRRGGGVVGFGFAAT